MTTDQPLTSTTTGRSDSLRQWWLVLAIVLAGLALRLYHIDNHGLFVDEIYSVLVATRTGDPELMQFDASRPLYFLLLHGWFLLASSETWLRLLSVLFGLGNIALIYLLGKNFAGGRVGLAAALITALSPMEIHYSQQVRMYTMGTFLVLSGTILLFKAFESEKKIFIAAWAMIRAMMVLTLPLTSVLLMVDGLYAINERKKTKLLPVMALCLGLLLAGWFPFLAILLKASHSPYDSWRTTLDAPNAVDYLTLLINFTASAMPLQESGGPPAYDWFSTAYVIAFPLVLGLAIASCHKQAKMVWCCAYGLLPLTALFIWSNIGAPLFITRYTMFTAPFVVLLLAFGWTEARARWRPVGFGIAAIYGLAMSTFIMHFYSNPVHEDWRPVSEFIASHERPGDQIVIWNYHSKYLLGYYYHGHNHVTDMKVRTVGKLNEDFESEIKEVNVELDFAPKPGQRLWIISREAAPGWTRMYKAYGLYKEALAKRFNVVSHEHFAMTDIYQATAR